MTKEYKPPTQNIVTCGNCSDIFTHKKEQQELTCPHCKYHSDACDFPDLFIHVDDSTFINVNDFV